MSKWNLIIKVGRCENCQNCVIAARDEHVGNDFPGYAAPAAADAESPIRILRRVQGASHMVETTYLPVMCNHCDDAPCMRVGGGAIRKRADGIVIIDPTRHEAARTSSRPALIRQSSGTTRCNCPRSGSSMRICSTRAGPARVVSSRALPMSSRRSSSMTPRWPRRPDARDSRYCDPTWARNPACGTAASSAGNLLRRRKCQCRGRRRGRVCHGCGRRLVRR